MHNPSEQTVARIAAMQWMLRNLSGLLDINIVPLNYPSEGLETDTGFLFRVKQIPPASRCIRPSYITNPPFKERLRRSFVSVKLPGHG